MQYDFVRGPLGSAEARAIIPFVKEEIKTRLKESYKLFFTRDTHGEDYLKTKAIPIVSYDSGEITGRKEPNENSLGRFVVLKETLKYVGFSTKYEI